MSAFGRTITFLASAALLSVNHANAQNAPKPGAGHGVGRGQSIMPRESASVTGKRRATGPCGAEYSDRTIDIDGVRRLFGLSAEFNAANWRQDTLSNAYQRYDGTCVQADAAGNPVINIHYNTRHHDLEKRSKGKYFTGVDIVFFDADGDGQPSPGDIPGAVGLTAAQPLPNGLVSVGSYWLDRSELYLRQQAEQAAVSYNSTLRNPRIGLIRPFDPAETGPSLADMAKKAKVKDPNHLSFAHKRVQLFQDQSGELVMIGDSWNLRQDTDTPATVVQSEEQSQRDITKLSKWMSIPAGMFNNNGVREAVETGTLGIYNYWVQKNLGLKR